MDGGVCTGDENEGGDPAFWIKGQRNIGATLCNGRGVSDVRAEDVQLRGQTMKEVDKFTYLGSLMASYGKFTPTMGKEKGKPQSENEDFQCCCAICGALWRECIVADEDRRKKTASVRNAHAEEYCSYDVGRFPPER